MLNVADETLTFFNRLNVNRVIPRHLHAIAFFIHFNSDCDDLLVMMVVRGMV